MTEVKSKVKCEVAWFQHYQNSSFVHIGLLSVNQAFRSNTTEMQILVEMQISRHTMAQHPLQDYEELVSYFVIAH